MKIFVITDLYPIKDNEKNTPRTIFDFVQGWEECGHEVVVIKPNFIFNSFLRRKPFYKSGVYGKVINLNYWTPFCFNVLNKLNRYAGDLLENDNLPELVIAHMPCGLLFADKLSLPFVAGVHVSDLEVLTNPIYSIYFRKKMRNAYNNAYKIAARSEVLKQKFLKLLPEYENKTFVAYSGIESKLIAFKGWQKKERYSVLTCARLIKRKNIDEVIKACEKLSNVDLTVIGDGSEYKKLKKLSSKTRFLGYLEHSKVIEEMRKADIFVLPSENETFGMVYLEAMASGCVTVGLKDDGIDGIIKDGFNGFLAKKNEIKETLDKIINSDNNEILKNAYNTIQNYTKDSACNNYLDNVKR